VPAVAKERPSVQNMSFQNPVRLLKPYKLFAADKHLTGSHMYLLQATYNCMYHHKLLNAGI